MTTQLRIYQVKDGKLDEWVDSWRTKIAPLLEDFGFRIDEAWTVSGTNQFIYLLTYDGPDDFEVKNDAYKNSGKRAALGVDVDEFLDAIQKFSLVDL